MTDGLTWDFKGHKFLLSEIDMPRLSGQAVVELKKLFPKTNEGRARAILAAGKSWRFRSQYVCVSVVQCAGFSSANLICDFSHVVIPEARSPEDALDRISSRLVEFGLKPEDFLRPLIESAEDENP